MKHLLSICLLFLFSITMQGQTLQLKLGTTYSTYTNKPLGSWQFGAYAGAACNIKLNASTKLKLETLYTQRGSKTPGRYWIFETHNFKTDYLQFSTGLEFRPIFHLSFSILPYYARMVRAQSIKWNYAPYTWNKNFTYLNEFGGTFQIEHHFYDANNKEAPISLQASGNLAFTRMAGKGFEMRDLHNAWITAGFNFKIY